MITPCCESSTKTSEEGNAQKSEVSNFQHTKLKVL